jgi:glycosyltransferase involved in cell wall biosynthesis
MKTAPEVVHNGSRPRRPAAASREDAVLTAGRLWDQGKGVRTLDAAAKRIQVPVFGAGAIQGPHGERIELEHMQALGSLESGELAARLARRPIFASPAMYEPFGLAVLEAAQAGCVLVLSDIPTFRELWDGTAVFVPADDPRALAEAVNGLLADPESRGRLETAARARAARYTSEATTAATLKLYRSLLPASAKADQGVPA